jgi:copper chaperone CopZ
MQTTVGGAGGPAGLATAELGITGMHCASCSALIEETLLEDLGVAGATVDLEAGRATVTYDPAQFSVADLCAAVVAAGYEAAPV